MTHNEHPVWGAFLLVRMKGKGEGARKQKKEKENCQNDKKTLDEKIFLLYNNRACLHRRTAKKANESTLIGRKNRGDCKSYDKGCTL